MSLIDRVKEIFNHLSEKQKRIEIISNKGAKKKKKRNRNKYGFPKGLSNKDS
tara:strand:+ start:53 stop:208 length:156 start_codon:yes stop_codon:yes gene_type:complete